LIVLESSRVLLYDVSDFVSFFPTGTAILAAIKDLGDAVISS